MFFSKIFIPAFILSISIGAQQQQAADAFRAEALGPLNRISDWNSFQKDLIRIKAAGVQALATDVWVRKRSRLGVVIDDL